uniref:EOG090X0ADZ n=1 Tax=Daphnia dolichocephala TaxID=2282166 RepID=A0A4Y7M406_9CRUS|nr:EOG090X0ADZ [Daphnia dolichocephala]
MSLNTAHANNGVLIYAGECILLYCDNVVMEFSGQDRAEFKGTKAGRLYLTTHRMIFNNSKTNDPLLSFSFPFCTMKDVELEQPMFGANYIKGKVRAQPDGGWVGEVKFKLHFKHGGAIEYGQAMLQAAALTKRSPQYTDEPPAYQPPSGPWHDAPPPSYSPPNGGYYGWVPPPSNAFATAPPANSVYMTDMPPPYPGINTGSGYKPSANDTKAAEAAASGTAYYDPNTHYAYVPPAYSNEAPPSYDGSQMKKHN